MTLLATLVACGNSKPAATSAPAETAAEAVAEAPATGTFKIGGIVLLYMDNQLRTLSKLQLMKSTQMVDLMATK